MAKKSSFRDLYGKWSAQEEQANAAQSNKLAQATAMLDSVVADGQELTDDQYGEALAQIMNTGSLDTAKLSGFSKPTAAPVVLPTATSGPQMSATTSQSVLDQLTTNPVELVQDIGANFRAGAREGLAGLLNAPATLANLGVRNPAVLAASKLMGVELPVAQNPKFLQDEAARLRADAANIRNVERSDRARVGSEVVADATGFGDTASAYLTNPTVLADELGTQGGQLFASLPGAAAGGTGLVVAQGVSAAGQQGQQAYEDVIAKGGSKEDAENARLVAGGISLAANTAIPLGVPGGSALENLIAGGASNVARRTAVQAAVVPLVGEATSEALTEVLDQGGLNLATGEPFSRGLAKAAAAGGILGGVMGAAPAAVDARAATQETAIRAANTESDILAGAERVRAPVLPDTSATVDTGLSQEQIVQNIDQNPNVDRELFNTEQDIAADESRTRSLDEAFSQREQEDQLQRQVEEEAGFRTIANQTNNTGTMADSLRSAGVETEVTPDQVALEMLQANAARQRPVEAVPAAPEVPAAPVAPRAKKAPMRKAKPVVDTAAVNEKLKASSDPLDRIQGMVSERLGMAGNAQAPAADFNTKVKTISRRLAGDSSARAGSVEKLINQGKIVIVPNAEAAGREATNRKGEYDVGQGTTYIYTDNLTDGTHAELMEAAAHESGHLGQFNERDQRPEIMRSLLGRGVTKASDILRKSAANGNTFAQEALSRATADTEARRAAGEENPERYENEELVAYAIGQENAGRAKTLGSASGAIRDAVAGAKNQLRTKLGVNLDLSANDVRAAMANMLQEAEVTDTASTSSDDKLGLIYGQNAADFNKAKEEGRVYTSTADGNQKFVLSDADSKLKPDAQALLASTANLPDYTVTVGQLMDHDVLFNNMPEARNIEVRIDPNMGMRNMGKYWPGKNLIEVSPRVAEGKSEATLRETVLHEVQHWMQEQDGGLDAFSPVKKTPAELKQVREFENARAANDQAGVAMMQLAGRIVNEMPGRTNKAIARSIINSDRTPTRKALDFARLVDDTEMKIENTEAKEAYNQFADTLNDYRSKVDGYNKLAQDFHKRYTELPTEAEAFFTQRNVDTPQAELPINPEMEDYLYGTPEGADIGRMALTRRVNNETLGMAGSAQQSDGAFRNKNKATTLIVSALRNDRGLGSHIRDEVELAKAAPVEFEAQANRAAGQYDAGINKLAAQRGATPAEVNAEIRAKLEEISNLDGTASEYKAAFDNIVKDYGQAGKALSRLRNLVDDLSADFIQTYLDSGKKLTEKEKDDIRKVAANLGRYVHRFYASRQGHGLGKKYSQAVQNAIDKAKEGKKSLTPKEQELYDRYANASKRILEGVVIPEDLESLSGSNIDYLYDTWIGTDPTLVDRDGKEAALAEIRDDVGMEDMQAKADAAVQSLLWGVENTAATRFYDRGEKLNTSIMQKRKSIPKEIRDLLGEVTDPAGALVATVSKQAEYVSRTKLMLSLRNMASPEDLQPPGSSGNAAVRNNNMKELTGEAYGPLQGYWASPSMIAMIGDTTEQLQNFTDAMITGHQNFDGVWTTMGRMGANAWMKAASGAKAVNIVGNLWRYPLNLMGSFAMLGVNGNLNVGSYGKGLKDSVDIIKYAATPSKGLGGADIASKYRVVDSATVGDLKNLDVGKIEQIVREMSGKTPGTFMRKARELGMAGKELYAMMDVWSKLANFHGEVDFLRSMYKSEGLTKSDDEIYREASAVVNNTNMSYSRTLPFLKALERGGVTQYGPYLYEAHRVVLANLYQGMLEMRRSTELEKPAAKAKMAARGLARMVGTAGVLAMLGALSHFAAGMWGDDEEDKRALLPEYARVMDFMVVGKDTEGRPILYGASNADPLGPITDLYRAARISDKPTEALWKQFKENYIAPALGGALWDAAAHTTGVIPATSPRPRKPLVAQWFPDGWSSVMGTTGNEDAWNSVASLIETRYMPGTPRAWSDSNPIAVGGGGDDVAYNTMRALGARALRYDPEVGTRDAAFGYDDTIKNLRRDLAAYFENTTNPSAEELTSRLLDMRKEERKAYEQLAKVRRGMLTLDMTEAEADAALKEAKVPAELIKQLGNEEFESRVISKESISSAAKTQIRKAKTEADKEKLTDKWESAWEILSELQGGE